MRDPVMFLIVVSLIPLIFWRPWIGILAWYWVGLMAPHGLCWGFMRSFPIAVAVGVPALIGLFIAKDRRPIPITREIIITIIFLFHITVTSIFAVYPPGAWDQWVKVIKIVAVSLITPMLIYGEKRVLALIFVVTYSVGFYGIKGGFFAITTGGSSMVLGPPGSYLQGNTFIGLAMIMVAPLMFVSARFIYHQWVDLGAPWLRKIAKPLGLALYGGFWLTIVAILVTYSRGALLGLLAITPWMFLKMRHKWVLILSGFVIFGVIGVAAPERLVARWKTIETYEEDQSAMQRIQAWGANFNMALERPLIGMGMSNASLGYDWWRQYVNFEGSWSHVLSAHSLYFQMLGQHGFLGLGIYLTMIGFTFFTLDRIRRTAVPTTGKIWLREYAWALQLSLVGFLVAGAFIDVAYFTLIYALIALAIIMRKELESSALPNTAATAQKTLSRARRQSVQKNR